MIHVIYIHRGHEGSCFFDITLLRTQMFETTAGWISVAFRTDSRGPQRTNHNNGGPPALHRTPPAGQRFHLAGWNISTFPTRIGTEYRNWFPEYESYWHEWSPDLFLFKATSTVTFGDVSEMSWEIIGGIAMKFVTGTDVPLSTNYNGFGKNPELLHHSFPPECI